MGSVLSDLRVVRVVDGDTVRLAFPDGAEESIRLTCVDTEESLNTGGKPVTRAGKLASEFLSALVISQPDAAVGLEFETDDPVDVALVKHRDNFGRLLAYLLLDGLNINLELVRLGWSPYFTKYGNAREHHARLLAHEAEAQAENRGIWNSEINAGGNTRDYTPLLPWWAMRAAIVEAYRQVESTVAILSVRLDYEALTAKAAQGDQATILCDLQSGVNQWTGGGAVIYAGSIHHKFNLWIPDVTRSSVAPKTRLITNRYGGEGKRGYVYVSGQLSLFNGRPQMVLTDVSQLSDTPPL